MVFDRKNQNMTGMKSSSWNLPVIMELTGQYASNERTREPFWTSCEPTVQTATTLLSKRQLMSLGMALTKPFSRSPAKGAETLVWLAESPEVANQSGGYFFDMKRGTSPQGRRSPVRGPGCGRSARPKCVANAAL